jgi:TolB protein
VAGKLPTLDEGADSPDAVAGELGMKKGDSSGVFCFVSDRDSMQGIYLKVLNRLAEFPLTRGRGAASLPILSFACGKCLFFEQQIDPACRVLRTMDLSGVNKWTVPFIGCITEASFSPDGNWLYFSGRTDSSVNDIYRIKPGGQVAVPVIAWKNSFEGSIAFSPDGKYMVFASNGGNGRQLFLADTAGFKPICLTEGNADNYTPRFSPSGQRLAFLSNKTSFNGSYDLWVYTAASGTVSQATFRSKVTDYCWLNDAKTIVYSSGDTVSSLKTMTVEGQAGIELIKTGLPKDYNELHPRTITWRTSIKIIYTKEMRNGERKIYWVNPDGTDNACIVDSKGQDWIE